jgi:hypothetical protein
MAKARPARPARRRGSPQAPTAPTSQLGKRELVMLARSEAGLRATTKGIATRAAADIGQLGQVLSAAGATVQPLFGLSEDRIRNRVAALSFEAPLPDMAAFYHVEAPEEQLEELADKLLQLDEVEAAYVKPAGEPPVAEPLTEEDINRMTPAMEEPPATTPDFSARQIYLNPAPAGINARYAWTLSGGRGAGIQIIDCEWGWRFTHEDLLGTQGGIVIGTGHVDDDHGTAVLGEYSGDRNSFGILGICSEARASAASFLTLPSATVIRQAADRLRRGDILLLEIHRAGPDASGVGQDGYIAIEWWPDDLAAIQYAVARGVIVVEAAGNGARNLDAAIYNQRPTGFPSTWRNPFNPNNPTSGAVVVGAGAPPPGTHGRNHGPDRSRLGFSNFGQRVDTQGWGREVTTTGYGDIQGGASRDLWYTDQFSGTSSASPIVVGALGCVQGILRARNRPLLTPPRARQVLRATGSPQQDAPGRPRAQRIGNRPDLRQMIATVLGLSPEEEEVGGGLQTIEERGRIVVNIHSTAVTLNIRPPEKLVEEAEADVSTDHVETLDE